MAEASGARDGRPAPRSARSVPGRGLALTALGIALQSLALAAADLGMVGVILYGAPRLDLFGDGTDADVVFPAAMSVGYPVACRQ